MIQGLFLGNDYPNTSYSLPDCCLDSARMFTAMQPYLAGDSEHFRNEECTLANIIKWVRTATKSAKPTDAFIVYNSGHGTTDGKKQGIVLHGGIVLWESKIRELLSSITPAVLISDSCFAGGLARDNHANQFVSRFTRYVPLAALRKRQPPPAGRMGPRQYDYFAACGAGETADSTGTGGAFTNEVLRVLASATPRLTMQGIHNRVRKVLPNAEHPQTPQFVASDRGFSRRTLRSFIEA